MSSVIIGFIILFVLCSACSLQTNTRTTPKSSPFLPTEIRAIPEVLKSLPTSTPQFMTVVLPFIVWAPTPAISAETTVSTDAPAVNLKEATLPTQITRGETVNIEEGCPNGCPERKEGCDIKGNISYSTGEKIYHVPGGAFYDKTVVDSQYGERWFCTEAEAIANGWRKSKR